MWNALKSFLLGILDVHVCDKLFRTAIVKGASFEQNVTIGEDRLFLMDCLIQSKRVSFMHEVFYHYYQNEQSAMHKNISTATVQVHRLCGKSSETSLLKSFTGSCAICRSNVYK